MKVTELFEDAKGPLIWSLIGKILNAGGSVKANIATWDNELAKNKPPVYYDIITATLEHDRFQKNDSYRLYFADVTSKGTSNWFEVMNSDDSEMKLAKQKDGSYILFNRDGAPIVA